MIYIFIMVLLDIMINKQIFYLDSYTCYISSFSIEHDNYSTKKIAGILKLVIIL